MAVQADGKIVVGGDFTTMSGVASNRIARLNADGIPDTTFTTNLGTGSNAVVYAVVVQADGRIVVGGFLTTLNGVGSNRVARLNADGTPDTTFTTNVGTGFNNQVYAAAVQWDGKIVVGGFFTTLNGAISNRIARLNADGTPDTTFATNVGTGFNNQVNSVAVGADGKIVVGGEFTTLNGVSSNRIARLNAAVPGAPTSVTGAAGNAQVAVAWTAPASIGGSAITGYQVQVATSAAGTYDSATGCATNSTTASCTATGLTNGQAYFFKVAAINAAGAGAELQRVERRDARDHAGCADERHRYGGQCRGRGGVVGAGEHRRVGDHRLSGASRDERWRDLQQRDRLCDKLDRGFLHRDRARQWDGIFLQGGRDQHRGHGRILQRVERRNARDNAGCADRASQVRRAMQRSRWRGRRRRAPAGRRSPVIRCKSRRALTGLTATPPAVRQIPPRLLAPRPGSAMGRHISSRWPRSTPWARRVLHPRRTA